jgi:hypothetical protein
VEERPSRETDEIRLIPASAASAPLSMPGEAPEWAQPRKKRQTEPLGDPNRPAARREEQAAPVWEEEVSAFSGNLPRLSRENSSRENNARESNSSRSRVASRPQPIIEEEEISPFSGNLPALNDNNYDGDDSFLTDGDEVSPFTGNLPNIRSQFPPREVVESTLIPVPSSDWRSQDQQGYQGSSRSAERQRREAREQPAAPRYTNGLWSYANKENIKKVEKRR